MSRRAVRQRLRARREELRRALADRKKALRADRRGRKPPTARRRALWALLLALVLLALLCARGCGTPPAPEPLPPPELGAGPAAATEAEPSTPLQGGRIAKKDRPRFQAAPPPPPGWLEIFRMQVAARSPRLAACFEGVERPGALRWAVSVDPAQGTVSDHVLEPTLGGGELSREQRACVLEVLATPRYRLPAHTVPGVLPRVSLVVEF